MCVDVRRGQSKCCQIQMDSRSLVGPDSVVDIVMAILGGGRRCGGGGKLMFDGVVVAVVVMRGDEGSSSSSSKGKDVNRYTHKRLCV